MQPVANTKTDADGHYKFDNPTLGTAPMLLRAVYRGVNYHEPVPPGKTTADVEVFEPTDKPSAVSVTAHAIILQPDGSDLDVGEEYNITNKTQPPLAYYKADGSFVYSLPAGASMNQVSAVSSAGMPVIQTPIDKGKNKEAIAFPFRPGDSGVRMSYKIPYANNQTKLTFVSPYAAERLGIFVPPTVQVSGDGLSPAGQEQGFNVYMRQSVAANTPFTISVSGTAPPPPQAGRRRRFVAGSLGELARRIRRLSAPTATATTLPARLDSLKWTIAAGFAASSLLAGFLVAASRNGRRRRYGIRGRCRPPSEAVPFQSGGRRSRAERQSAGQPRRAEGNSVSPGTAPPGRHYQRRRLRARTRPHSEAPARSGKRLATRLVRYWERLQLLRQRGSAASGSKRSKSASDR